MKRKLLLFLLIQILLLPAAISQDTIRHLIISKWNGAQMQEAFAQITNVGDSSIDLSRFTFYNINASLAALSVKDGYPVYNNGPRYALRLQGRLGPGESMLLMNVWDHIPASGYTHQLEKMLPLADVKVHCTDLNTPHPIAIPELEVYGKDSVDKHDFLLRHWSGAHASVLYYRLSDTDSVMIDQVNLAFNPTTMRLIDKPSAVAGVTDASFYSFLVRKANVKRGNTNWDNARGISAEDSEWIAIPKWQGRTPYSTLKNFGNFSISLQSSTALINNTDTTITVEWGVERGDSILKELNMGPGMGWQYILSPSKDDSAYNTVREGDILQVFACGNALQQKYFKLKVGQPASNNTLVFPKRNMNFTTGYWSTGSRYYVTKGNPAIDTIGNVPFATRVDTLFKYLEKVPAASWEINWVDGKERVDLKYGDKLKVTAANGTTVKEYFIDVQDYEPSDNAMLSAITWPDLPFFLDGWKGDTIPTFTPIKQAYAITLPYGTSSVPALKAIPQNLRAKIQTTRARSLSGSLEERTTTFSVTAEDDSTNMIYTIIFSVEKPDELIQKYKGHPFISEVVTNMASWVSYLEIVNPRNEALDLSEYLIVRSTTLNPGNAISNAIPAVPTDALFKSRYISYVPGYKYSDDTTTWKLNPGKLYIDPEVNPVVEPGDVFVMASISIGRYIYITPEMAAVIDKRWDSGDAAQIDQLGVDVRATPPALKRGAEAVFLYKILNDSVLSGTKPVGDPKDFLLVDAFGDAVADANWIIAGKTIANNKNARIRLKSHVYKGVTTLGEGLGTDAASSNWIVDRLPEEVTNGLDLDNFIGSHSIDPITVYLSTISSLTYLVSDGFEELQTIQGDLSGKTYEQFLQNISKGDAGQTLSLKSTIDGTEKLPTDLVADNDTLVVVSADGVNTTKYKLINQPLDNDAVLIAKQGSGYTITINGSTASINGISYGTTITEVLENVTKPSLATLNVINAKGDLVPLQQLNYDTVYVATLVRDDHYFEVSAQDGVTVITYQLVPEAQPGDAYVTSTLYNVNQDSLIISGIPGGTSVALFFNNIQVVRGASAKLYDKAEFLRELGFVSYDDRLEVTSQDMTKKVLYYLDFQFEMNPDRPVINTQVIPAKSDAEYLNAYPNPTRDLIYLKGVNPEAVIRVTDLMGRTLSIHKGMDINGGIDLSDKPAGIYLLIVTEVNQPVRHARIMKH